MSDALDRQTTKIVASLKLKPELLHSVQKAIRDLWVCQPWQRTGSHKVTRYTMDAKRVAIIRPARSDEGGKWRARLSLLVVERHNELSEEDRSRSFESEMESKEWLDRVLVEAGFVLM